MFGAPAQALGKVFRDLRETKQNKRYYATMSCLAMSCDVLWSGCLFEFMHSHTCQRFLLVQRGQGANRSSKQPSGAAHCHPWWEFHRNSRNLLPFRIEIKYFLIFSLLDLSWPHAKHLWCAVELDLMWEYPASPAVKRSCWGRQQPVRMEPNKIPLLRFAAC